MELSTFGSHGHLRVSTQSALTEALRTMEYGVIEVYAAGENLAIARTPQDGVKIQISRGSGIVFIGSGQNDVTATIIEDGVTFAVRSDATAIIGQGVTKAKILNESSGIVLFNGEVYNYDSDDSEDIDF